MSSSHGHHSLIWVRGRVSIVSVGVLNSVCVSASLNRGELLDLDRFTTVDHCAWLVLDCAEL